MKLPKITIITPSYNQGEYLEETIQSIISQNYPDLEFIIMDGGSNDNSLDVIRKYENNITYWESGKDRGQTHAINKGIDRASGDIINWINSDDKLAPGSLEKVAKLFMKSDPLCVTGYVTIFNGKKEWSYPPAWEPEEDLTTVIARDSYNQPGTFFSRHAIDLIGKPDESLHYVMDKEWFIRFLLKFGTDKIVRTDDVLALHRYHETSKTISEGSRFLDEYAAIISSMADLAGKKGFRDLLSMKYDFGKHTYRFVHDLTIPPVVIERMAATLLLRRYNRIDNENDFLFAKKLVALIPREAVIHSRELEQAWEKLNSETKFGNWTLYRIARKAGLTN